VKDRLSEMPVLAWWNSGNIRVVGSARISSARKWQQPQNLGPNWVGYTKDHATIQVHICHAVGALQLFVGADAPASTASFSRPVWKPRWLSAGSSVGCTQIFPCTEPKSCQTRFPGPYFPRLSRRSTTGSGWVRRSPGAQCVLPPFFAHDYNTQKTF